MPKPSTEHPWNQAVISQIKAQDKEPPKFLVTHTTGFTQDERRVIGNGTLAGEVALRNWLEQVIFQARQGLQTS